MLLSVLIVLHDLANTRTIDDFRYRCEAEKIFYHREDVYITVVECLAASEGYQVILSVRGHDGANKVLQKTEPRENVEKALDLAQLMVRGQAQVLVEKKLESRGQGQSTGKPIEMVVEEVHKIWMRKIERKNLVTLCSHHTLCFS